MTTYAATVYTPPRAAKRARRPALALTRLAAILLLSILCHVLYMLMRCTARSRERQLQVATQWTRRWARALLHASGFRTCCHGRPLPGAMLTPNHMGYLDILALGSCTETLFVAKNDMASWPLIGRLMHTSWHVFVDRHSKRALHSTCADITERLTHGSRVCVFLEGTSTGGDRLLPFRAGLLKPAIETGAALLPVAIRYEPRTPDVNIAEEIAYWRDEHALASHLWRLLQLDGGMVHITFGAPVNTADKTRPQLARELEHEVRRLLQHPSRAPIPAAAPV